MWVSSHLIHTVRSSGQHSFYSYSRITFLVNFKGNICLKNQFQWYSRLCRGQRDWNINYSKYSNTTHKRSSKKCGRNEVFDLVQNSLDSDIIRETFHELLQDMNKINAVKLRTVGETECLSLPKEVDMATNRMVNDLATFHLQLDKFKSSLN